MLCLKLQHVGPAVVDRQVLREIALGSRLAVRLERPVHLIDPLPKTQRLRLLTFHWPERLRARGPYTSKPFGLRIIAEAIQAGKAPALPMVEHSGICEKV